MLRNVTQCAFAAICVATLAGGAALPQSSTDRQGGLSRPKLKFACELDTASLAAMFTDSSVMSDLSDLGAGVSLAILDMTPQRAFVVRRLNQANIPDTAWLLLPKDQGYFFNTENAAAASSRFDAFEAWSGRYRLQWDGIGLDIEPDFEELQRLAHGGLWQLVPALVQRAFDHQRIRKASQDYKQLFARIHAHGYPVEVYQMFFMADEREACSTLLERLLGVVDVSGDRQCLMLYTSFHHSWRDSVIWAYGAEAGAIVIGSTGGDSKLDEGFAPLNWDEFLRDLRAARSWTNEIGVYRPEGSSRNASLSWKQRRASNKDRRAKVRPRRV